MSLRDDITTILNNEGAASEGGWHSWRCFDKGRYPEPCHCTETVAEMVVAAVLDAAREAVAALHQRVPVIECRCWWGKDCSECGSESNRVVGYACERCCNSFGDHAYCDDLHYDDDTSLHHQDGMWSGPHCPTLAAIDALRERP